MTSPDLARALPAWFAQRLAADSGEMPLDVVLDGFETPQGVGHSNETVLCTLHWRDSTGVHGIDLVVRLETVGSGVFPTYDLATQVHCMQAVGAHSAVPVPHVRWVETDRAMIGRGFYVMDRIDAVVPADRMPYSIEGWLFEASPAEQRRLWESSIDTLAALHGIDVATADFAFLDLPGHGPSGIVAQHASWDAYMAWVLGDRREPTLHAAAAWLHANRPEPSHPNGLSWGDARISNIMYRDFTPVAVLDWEMASLGPGEIDLAWFLFFRRFFSQGLGVADLAGFTGDAESIARYEAAVGRSVDDLFWYEVFAAWRHSTIMLRLADMYEAAGEFPKNSGAGANNIATRMLAAMLDLPSPGEPGGFMG